MSALDAMIEAAARARENAHAPYSGFQVGACLRTDTGAIYAGCNVENAAYPQGQRADGRGLGAMVAAGERRIVEVVVLAEGEQLCTPCGGCRQRLSEFAAPDTPVHVCGPEGARATISLGELLPHGFGPANLASDER